MKTFKYLFIVWMLVALLPVCVFAQDGRQRDYQTIVADGLAQLPISEPEKREKVMAELTHTGTQGMEMIAGMLVPADKGKNATVEYAISGIVNYVTVAGNEEQRKAIRKGLTTSIDVCTDPANRAFLLSQLQLCATTEDASVFIKYLKDPYLADGAIRGLVSTTGSDAIILDLMQKEAASRDILAHAAYERRLTTAEPILLDWLKGADKDTQNALFKALSVCGSSASLKVLSAAAKNEAYEWSKDKEATAAYFTLLSRLVANGEEEKAVKASKKLLKSEKPYLRGAALDVLLSAEKEKGMSYILSALKDKDIEVRNSALRSASAFAGDKEYAAIADRMPSLPEEAHIDIINWFGTRHANSQLEAVIAAMQSPNDALALAGIGAAGRIGGKEALHALIAQLDGKHAEKATATLLAFNGEIKEGVKAALNSTPTTQVKALKLASERCISEVSPQVFTMLQSTQKEVKEAAYNALSGVVLLTDFERVADLLASSEPRYTAKLQQALISAIKTQTPEKQYAIVSSRMSKSAAPSAYYPILAQTHTAEAIELLNEAFSKKGEEVAFKALLEIDNPQMIDTLYQIAKENPALKEQALTRYTSLVSKSTLTDVRKYQYYQQALDLNPSVDAQKQVLKALASIQKFPALMLASNYLDNKETAADAAATIKTIIAKSDERLGGDTIKVILQKVQAIYKTLPGADAGYAVDEISNLLSQLQSAPVFTLPTEEKKEGYEVLFDGTSLHKWTGNTNSYVIENGTIYVSAGYGSGGNLYTQKEYSDFVLRFEFCFDREGVNNGIGIRTPMGVDAAYEGMEIQILDHDAPIYKGLHEYQQHGSVYGIIPAKRVKFGPLGTWNVEEIRVVGDRITVTVNGEVILDGNIRKACQGNNVSKDGSKKNPFTVDKRNHPGLFNKKGHIGLCGHGAGIRFRNMRVLDLGSK